MEEYKITREDFNRDFNEWVAIILGGLITLLSIDDLRISIIGIFLIWFGVSGIRHKRLMEKISN